MQMDDKKKRQSMIVYVIVAIVAAFAIRSVLYPSLTSGAIEEVSYSDFLGKVDSGEVKQVQLDTGASQIRFTTGDGDSKKTYKTTQFPNDDDLVKKLQDKRVDFSATIPDQNSNLWLYMLISYGIPLLLIFGGGWLLNRRLRKQMGDDAPSMNFGGGFGMGGGLGRSNVREVKGKETGVTFKDVAGQDEAKESLAEIVSFLEHPEKYAAIGARCPRGALLVGPPGTGKTLMARAVAGEAGVPFLSISGPEFVELFVGMGASKVRDLFKEAREKAPCIVFIDEIDAIGKKRDGFGGNDEREQTLNQLLSEMDGFEGNSGVVVLAATNRPESLDKALLRPGRFDRRVPVELPDQGGREAILRIHCNRIKTEGEIDLAAIARITPGASGADLANVINEAALCAVRSGRHAVTQKDLEDSVDVALAGKQRKSMVISQREKEIIAYHEVGHALVAAKQKGASPVHKITIIPRTSGALGFTMQADEDERFLMDKQEAFAKIVTLTGGRAAEELCFDSVTTGASNDIEQATSIARAMITRYGMSESFGMTAFEQMVNPYLGNDTTMNCSQETAARIDREVIALIDKAYDQAKTILKDNRSKLDEIAHVLIARETITGQEFMDILNAPVALPVSPEEAKEE